jgi:chromodomain-helicase-DNA-binding protein 1
MRHRIGRPTAVGHATTFYNVEANGDPNAGFATNTERGERQFLIKWVGWSHLHNTWESDASLQAINARGMKKVENYVKRMREIEDWYV